MPDWESWEDYISAQFGVAAAPVPTYVTQEIRDYFTIVPVSVRLTIAQVDSSIRTIAEALPWVLGDWAETFRKEFTETLEKTTLSLFTFIEGIKEFFTLALEKVKEWALATFATLEQVWQSFTTKLNEWSSSIWTKVLAWWQPQLAKLNEWWSGQLAELGQWWETQLAELAETFSFVLEFRDDIIDLFTDPEAWLLRRIENMLVRFW